MGIIWLNPPLSKIHSPRSKPGKQMGEEKETIIFLARALFWRKRSLFYFCWNDSLITLLSRSNESARAVGFALTLSLFCTSIMRKPVDTWFVWWVKRKICKSEIINSDVSPVDLLPLRPASLTHKIPRRRQIIHENASSRTQRSVDRSEDVFSVVECCSCDFCGSYYGCHLTNNIYFSLCYALK